MLDDEPVTLKTTHKPVVALPYNFELHDIVMMALQNHPSEEMYRRSMDAFDCLYEESKDRAKIMSIAVHPYLSGQTHRIKHVERTFEDILSKPGVACWSGEKILDWYLGTQKDAKHERLLRPARSEGAAQGRRQRPARRPQRRGQGHVRHRRRAHRRRQSGLARQAQRPRRRTAASVQKLLDAGATITGKTICDEFFYSVAGMNAHYGTPTNIRAPGRIPGGSSSGSAAATAAGVCDFALGSDTGGSVRIPASLCGLYGIRTTHGRDRHQGRDGHVAVVRHRRLVRGDAPACSARSARVLLGGSAVAAPIEQLLVADDALRPGRRRRWRALLRDALGRDGRRRCRSRSTCASRRTASIAWRDAVRIIQAYEIWQVYGQFVDGKASALRPGRRRAHAGRLEDHQGRGRRRARRARRRARAHPRADCARHGRRAAERALHRAADRHAGGASWNPTASASCG